ncbi:hypothetical protein G6N74_29530 [Mesorhizobium sp. CGMCC 1.15528]|uniref:Uncharacterized protein n=1 Tax=Mesorhizobium zhangyense TaxID=1776730 RepID=A0A7C9RCJ7_9HYPH|nr:hypothetical protein [Mesorhizobium zhangyense]NGN45198.1 hypothetical protein [Mesorhizobium zhangyense]
MIDEKSSFLRDVCKRLRREFGHPTGSKQGMEIANDILALFESGITDEEALLSAYRESHAKHRPNSEGEA